MAEHQYELPENAIGWKDEMSEEELAGKHVDGLTGAVFNTEEDYLNHTSPATGFTPADPEHQGEDFIFVQQAALQRGAEKAEGEEKERTEAAIEDLGVTPPEPQ